MRIPFLFPVSNFATRLRANFDVNRHVSGGLYANILERPADIQKEGNLPLVLQQTCTDWMRFTNSNAPDQIDSGV